MFPNETICVLESEYSGQEIQEVGTGYGIGIATIIGIIAAIGLVIRGIFIYYIKYEAPGDRPINQMILSDQVGSYLIFVLISGLVKVISPAQFSQVF